MKPKKQLNQDQLIDQQLDEAFFGTENAACPTECTGLIYRPVQNLYEEEAYNDIYHFLPPTNQADEKIY